MDRIVQQLAGEALKLDEESRAHLALILLRSLEGAIAPSGDPDLLALKEANRRDRELVTGAVRGRSWEDVLAVAREHLGSGC